MGKNRREKRKLARLSSNPNYIKPYNYKVRQHNEVVREQRKNDKIREIAFSLLIIISGIAYISYKIWQN